MLYALMTNLHISEREALCLRWDRACEYLNEMRIDMEQPHSRIIPVLPEEITLKNIMQKEYDRKWRRKQ